MSRKRILFLILVCIIILIVYGCTVQDSTNSSSEFSIENNISKATVDIEYMTPGRLVEDYTESITSGGLGNVFGIFTLGENTYMMVVRSLKESTDSKRIYVKRIDSDGEFTAGTGYAKVGQKGTSILNFAYHRGETFMVLYNSTVGSITVARMDPDKHVPDALTQRIFLVEPDMTAMDLRAMDSTSSAIVMVKDSGTTSYGNNMSIMQLSINSRLQPTVTVKKRYLTKRTGWTNIALFKNLDNVMTMFLYGSGKIYLNGKKTSDGINVNVYSINNDYSRNSTLVAEYKWGKGWDNVQYREKWMYSDRKYLLVTRNDNDSNGNNVAVLPIDYIGETDSDTYWFDALDKNWPELNERSNSRITSFNVGTGPNQNDFILYVYLYDVGLYHGNIYRQYYDYFGYKVVKPRVLK